MCPTRTACDAQTLRGDVTLAGPRTCSRASAARDPATLKMARAARKCAGRARRLFPPRLSLIGGDGPPALLSGRLLASRPSSHGAAPAPRASKQTTRSPGGLRGAACGSWRGPGAHGASIGEVLLSVAFQAIGGGAPPTACSPTVSVRCTEFPVAESRRWDRSSCVARSRERTRLLLAKGALLCARGRRGLDRELGARPTPAGGTLRVDLPGGPPPREVSARLAAPCRSLGGWWLPSLLSYPL